MPPWTTGAPKPPSVEEPPARAPGWPSDRRRFLTGVGAVVAVAAVSGFAGRWLAGRRSVAVARSEVALPTPVASPPTVPPGADLNVAQLTPYVTPNASFYRIEAIVYFTKLA